MRRHVDIFAGTIAEMTWPEVDKAAKDGAVLLWAFGVIEQHGPHLPTGTDVYLPSIRLRQVKRLLAVRGVQALIVPPYYWGVNEVSGSFPASYRVRPSLMTELMADVFESLERDGFKRVFCISGHGDALHNRTIYDGVRLGSSRTALRIRFLADEGLAARLDLQRDDPYVATFPSARPRASGILDVHAGRFETGMMLCACARLVRNDVRVGLKATAYGSADLAEWRKGSEHARRKTPLGYFGDPAAASAAEGRRVASGTAQRITEVIERELTR